MLKYLIKTPSTQTHVKNGEFENREGVYTFNQTDGIGRLGTKWDTSEEEAVCFSFKLKSDTKFPMSMIIGVELAKIFISKNVQIKWPNDLYVNGQKFCGILVDKSDGVFVVGIGINTKSKRFGEIDIDKDSLVEMIQKFIHLDFNKFDQEYFERKNILNNHNIMIDGNVYEYDFIGEDGSLNIKCGDEVINLTDKSKIDKTLIKKVV